MSALLYRVGADAAELIAVPDTLKASQALVSGNIELVTLFDNVVLICNEDGRNLGLPLNRWVGVHDIHGDFFVAALVDSKLTDLSSEQIARVNMFRVLGGGGRNCEYCGEPMTDSPLRYLHRECGVRAVIGSVAHQSRQCSCYGGTEEEEDRPGQTRRQAAIEAYEYWVAAHAPGETIQ